MNRKRITLNSTPDAEAAAWIARRDRGLSPHEQDEYLQWLRADERHSAAVPRAEAMLQRVLQLSTWRHEHSPKPNPDLLARTRPRRVWFWSAIAATVAAVFIFGLRLRAPVHSSPAIVAKINYLHVNERLAMPDGSVAELRDGSIVEVHYANGERRVRLSRGEAQFSVMKDSARPFIVEAGGVAFKALGTVFDVRLDNGAVELLVTEGKVRVGRAATDSGKIFQAHSPADEPPTVSAGERAVVSLDERAASPVVSEVSSEDIRHTLEWQVPRLQFDETPLAEAIAEFNRRNARQLVLGDANLGALPIGGTFRADNVEGFVRLLSMTLDVRAEQRGTDETVLWRGH